MTVLKDLAVRARDLTCAGVDLRGSDGGIDGNTTLFRGAFWHRELRRGLHVHASDVIEEADFCAVSSQQAGLYCIFFLDGEVSVEMGGRRFSFCGRQAQPQATVVTGARMESFRRLSRGRQHVRHVVVWATPEWLDHDSLPELAGSRSAARFLSEHLADRRFVPDTRMRELVRDILTAQWGPPFCRDLMIESAAIELMARSLAASVGVEQNATKALSIADRARIERAESFIAAAGKETPSLSQIASAAGLSVSSLQRLFRSGRDTSVIDYVRRMRLAAVRDRLRQGQCTIQQAAIEAGYTSAANFSTAFKREFGASPGQVRGARSR